MRLVRQAAPVHGAGQQSLEASERRLHLAHRATVVRPASRLAAVLVADIVAYSRHMAEDEAGTHALLIAIFRNFVEPRIARENGRIVKTTGDGFLAEFRSATHAAWFAVEFQGAARAWNARRRRSRRLDFRIGINLGDVIVEAHDIFGHSVNVAARLQALAEPAGVLVSHAVRLAVRDPRLAFEDLGDLALRNINETVRGFRLRRSAACRFGRETSSVRDSGPGLRRPESDCM
jgi:adenylate cyclase